MPAKHFTVAKKVDKAFLKFPRTIQERILTAYDAIETNPIRGIKLQGELATCYKYRMGDYRIVYTFQAKTSSVHVVKVEHRQGVYK